MSKFVDYENMAMLDLSESELAVIKVRFDAITDSFSALDAYDTDGAEPLITVLDLHNVMREDVSAKLISKDELLKNAPEQSDGYFSVPAAIE